MRITDSRTDENPSASIKDGALPEAAWSHESCMLHLRRQGEAWAILTKKCVHPMFLRLRIMGFVSWLSKYVYFSVFKKNCHRNSQVLGVTIISLSLSADAITFSRDRLLFLSVLLFLSFRAVRLLSTVFFPSHFFLCGPRSSPSNYFRDSLGYHTIQSLVPNGTPTTSVQSTSLNRK